MTETNTIDLQVPIENLEITVRAFNSLKREGIHTVGDLIKFSEVELLDIRSIGTDSVGDLRAKLADLGLAFKAGPPVSAPRTKTEIDFKTHENKMRRYAERQGYLLVKSPRRDPRARGYGQYILVPDDRATPGEKKDSELIADAHLSLDRGKGLTLLQLEEKLGYAPEEQ